MQVGETSFSRLGDMLALGAGSVVLIDGELKVQNRDTNPVEGFLGDVG